MGYQASDTQAERAADASLPFGFSLTDFHMQVSMMFHLMRACNHPYQPALGLGPGQPRILSYLAVHGASPQRDIANHFSIDPAAVSRMLDTLGREGFVRRVPGEDRRRRTVELTEKGIETVAAWDRVCALTDGVMLAGLTDAERACLRGLLSRVQSNMRAHLARSTAADKDAADQAPAGKMSANALMSSEAPLNTLSAPKEAPDA